MYDPNLNIKYVGRAQFEAPDGNGGTTRYKTPIKNFADDVAEWIYETNCMMQGLLCGSWLILASSKDGQPPWRVVQQLKVRRDARQRSGFQSELRFICCPCCERTKEQGCEFDFFNTEG